MRQRSQQVEWRRARRLQLGSRRRSRRRLATAPRHPSSIDIPSGRLPNRTDRVSLQENWFYLPGRVEAGRVGPGQVGVSLMSRQAPPGLFSQGKKKKKEKKTLLNIASAEEYLRHRQPLQIGAKLLVLRNNRRGWNQKSVTQLPQGDVEKLSTFFEIRPGAPFLVLAKSAGGS